MSNSNEDHLIQMEIDEDNYAQLESYLDMRKDLLLDSLREDPAGVSEEMCDSLSTYISDGHGEFFQDVLTGDLAGVCDKLEGWVDWHIYKEGEL